MMIANTEEVVAERRGDNVKATERCKALKKKKKNIKEPEKSLAGRKGIKATLLENSRAMISGKQQLTTAHC